MRILRGAYRGRVGWISGTLEDRAARGVTRAIVKFPDALPELLAICSLEPIRQLALFATASAKRPPPGPGPGGGR